ncbi:MAG: hypothetical protein Q8P89_03025 [bacterium]|nr:hypothetical protein [bacterium]
MSLKEAILKTLAYADIFDYPLKEEEIWHRLIWNTNGIRKSIYPNESEWEKTFGLICRSSGELGFKGSYYFLLGRQKLVDIRQKREGWGQEKWKKAQRAAGLFKVIPTVKMIAVTGNLAVENCDKEDDIDLLIVATPGSLWLTRLLAILLLEITGKRRRPEQKTVCDKLCLNMFLDEDHLQIPSNEQDLYTAHEVVQLKLLWDRGGVYQKFLAQNRWVKSYLPNGVGTEILGYKDTRKGKKSLDFLMSQSLSVFEHLARNFQLWYMRKRRTTEVISGGVIRFHPHDARLWIFDEYQNRLRQFPY